MPNTVTRIGLSYLEMKPKKINWKVVAGPPNYKLSSIQRYDIVFDAHDLKIRGI